MVAFSQRVANLVATEILNTESVKMRARMISRFINATDKLNRLGNMQSATSVLYGLQSAPVYRLKMTWHYLRRHHSIKYQRLCLLMRLYNDPKSAKYKRMVDRACRTPPYIPSVAYLVSALLARVPRPETLLPPSSIRSGIICQPEL
ncbi:hypothetical protein AAG570_005625 [Ranatra chinensis]|uniref:Ras-GEF domain-containing protein n=1 Tax=Ranatra chinensis TaxID=642074 RepID=A0ABD0XZN4_9HEMI